ncbi:DNA RNA-binding KIN17 [Labeo rohita]|uniref:DNA RNA-binding KIN17 n=1 Tax=Labeo rohita TaxID=84645 RepID=A0A498L7N0_LABRO|nr:DNA RNA-binding KIN17 [Labeo rohita]RXN05104.1 DNA RNA-binding KIN17 [Labeo rohita]
MSESHQRQLLLASENPNQFMSYFSEEFKSDFLELLRRRFGYCKVDETPKGWYIQYIDRDPETIRRQEELERKKKQDMDDEERSAKFIEEQVRRGREGKEPEEEPVYTELKRANEDEKVAFNLDIASAGPSKTSTTLGPSALKAAASAKRKESSHSGDSKDKKKKSALDEIMEACSSLIFLILAIFVLTLMEEQKKKSVRSDNWIQANIVVKVITKKLGEKYYKKKAIIREVQDKYTAVVKMIDSGDKLKLDQSHLETVIPAPGKRVLIVNGQYKDTEAILEGINEHKFSATLTLDSGRMKGKTVEGVAYEDFSKLA